MGICASSNADAELPNTTFVAVLPSSSTVTAINGSSTSTLEPNDASPIHNGTPIITISNHHHDNDKSNTDFNVPKTGSAVSTPITIVEEHPNPALLNIGTEVDDDFLGTPVDDGGLSPHSPSAAIVSPRLSIPSLIISPSSSSSVINALVQSPLTPKSRSRISAPRSPSRSPSRSPTPSSGSPDPLEYTSTIETTHVVTSYNEQGQKQINEYVVEGGDIGCGSFATVKLVYHTEKNMFFAMKVMSKSHLKKRRLVGKGMSADHWEQVMREISIMKKLHHPNIVKLYEVMDDPNVDQLYLILEYMEGGCVLDLSTSTTPLPTDLARLYFRDIVLGLSYLHSQNIVHRDIKPENLLVKEEDNGNLVVKIGDFGVSTILESDNDLLSTTAGSAAFMAPEMCSSSKKFSGKKADIWSLGITLYSFIFGRLPFTARTVHLVYLAIVEHPLQFPTDVEASDDCKDLISIMLEKDPAKRADLETIKRHPWVTENGTWNPES